MSEAAKTARDELRAATLGAPSLVSSRLVEWNGKTFEVRLPSLKQQRFLKTVSTDKKTQTQDEMKALLFGIIECVYVPGTDVKVFEAADVEAFMDRTSKDFIGTFMKALGQLAEIDPDEALKNSESAPTE